MTLALRFRVINGSNVHPHPNPPPEGEGRVGVGSYLGAL